VHLGDRAAVIWKRIRCLLNSAYLPQES